MQSIIRTCSERNGMLMFIGCSDYGPDAHVAVDAVVCIPVYIYNAW